MYLTAASAACRYSGNVTGPDSRFSSPRTIGVPLAFLGVPSASAAGAVAAAVVFGVAAVLAESLLLLLPQPAAAAAASESARSAPGIFNRTLM
ncbi:MAG: hypothetical protein JWR63_3173 [Conexibacter sp.]|nr:hypothetical protein [Conexibacter sp.]